MTTTRIVGVLCTAFALAASAAPQVSNRPAAPDEWGYRPADHATVHLNPPSLIWLHEPPARTYCVQWSAAADFSSATTIDKLPFNTYTHTAPLPPGTYFWHYRFTDKTGQASNWSTTRSFTIAKDATEFPMPNRAQQAQRLPKDHPRLFMRPEDLPRLRQLAAGEEKDRFDQLRRTAERLLKTPPTPEPTTRASARDDATRQWWWPNRETAIKACDEAGVLAFVYLITQDQKYGQGARDRILRLAAWDPDGPTNFALNDEAAFPMLYRLPRAYDWAYDALTPADREKVQKVMTRRGDDVWKSSQVGFGVGHLTKPYASHANRAWHKLAECAIAFYDTIPAAPDWLDFAVNNFYAAYPVWSDDDGGWHEGLAYENGYMSKVTWWLQVSKTALDIDGFKKPFFSQVGDFALYLAPPHTPNMGFGDLSYNTPSGWGGTWEYFIRGVHASHAHPPTPGADRSEAPDPSDHSPYWLWWKDQYHMPGETGVLGFLYHAHLGGRGPAAPPNPPPTSPNPKSSTASASPPSTPPSSTRATTSTSFLNPTPWAPSPTATTPKIPSPSTPSATRSYSPTPTATITAAPSTTSTSTPPPPRTPSWSITKARSSTPPAPSPASSPKNSPPNSTTSPATQPPPTRASSPASSATSPSPSPT